MGTRAQLTRAVLTVAVGTLVIMVSGCGDQVSQSGTPAHLTSSTIPNLTLDFKGPITSPLTYQGKQITLDPPPPGTAPAQTAVVALHDCETGDSVCFPGPGATVLAEVTSQVTGGSIQPDGHTEPTIVNRLSYVTTWESVGCLAIGGSFPGYQGKPAPSTATCTLVTVVDANSGNVLFGFES